MKNIFSFIAIILSISFISCKHKFGISRGIKPVFSYDINIKKGGYALMHTRDFDILIEQIDEHKWTKLLKQDQFLKERKAQAEIRVPKFIFFQMVISNVSRYPLKINSIKLAYGKFEKTPLPLKEILKRCKSPAYSMFNFKSILNSKRLLTEKSSIKKINYNKNAIGYKFSFISPGDRILRIYAFEWIPVQYRHFKIITSISGPGRKIQEKVIDFNFNRYEYRTRGKVFKRKRDEPVEDNN